MKKILLITVGVVLLILVVVIAAGVYKFNFTNDDIYVGNNVFMSSKDATYNIEGEPVTLVNGLAETDITPGSEAKKVTRYFGNEVTGDVNGDGKTDVAFLLTQTSGGSGTFYYVAVALGAETRYQGMNAVLLGDRIAPQSTEIKDGTIVVNYAERKPGESFAVAPSVGVSKYFKFMNNILQDIGDSGVGVGNAKQACDASKGVWAEEYKECSGIDESTCASIGGEFKRVCLGLPP